MNYKNIYDKIIERSKNRTIIGYVEKHHIIPRALGGTSNKENIVNLKAREHFLCHYLLVKIKPCFKTYCALWNMVNGNKKGSMKRHAPSGRVYELVRTEFAKRQSEYKKGISRPEEVMRASHESLRGKPSWNKGIQRTEDEKKAISDGWKRRRGIPTASKGKPKSKEHCFSLSESHRGKPSWNKGIPCSSETKKKITETRRKKKEK